MAPTTSVGGTQGLCGYHDVRSPRSREASVGSNVAQKVCKTKTGVDSDLDLEKQHNRAFYYILGKVEGRL